MSELSRLERQSIVEDVANEMMNTALDVIQCDDGQLKVEIFLDSVIAALINVALTYTVIHPTTEEMKFIDDLTVDIKTKFYERFYIKSSSMN